MSAERGSSEFNPGKALADNIKEKIGLFEQAATLVPNKLIRELKGFLAELEDGCKRDRRIEISKRANEIFIELAR